jgi:hypothetical protein
MFDTDVVRRTPPCLSAYWYTQLASASHLIHLHSNEAIGPHRLEHTDPNFYDKVERGVGIVVA